MRSVVSAALAGAGIGIALLGLFFALNYLSLGRGGDHRIEAAFANDSLVERDFPHGDSIRGYNQFNDCLVLGMALDQRYDPVELTVSPSRPFRPGAPELCAQLRAGEPQSARFFYHNYIHGQTMLARYLLPVLPVEKIRELYRIAITLTLLIGVAIAMLRLAKGQMVCESLVSIAVLLSFARAFGLESFGQSIAHGPSDLILALFLLAFAVAARALTRVALIVISAAFGALTMIFEFLTGGLPLGLAAVVGLSWFALRPEHRQVGTVLAASVAFLSAAAAALVVKFVAVAFVFGPDTLLGIGLSGAQRLGGEVPAGAPRTTLPGALINGMEAMIPGMGAMAFLLILIAAGFGAWAVLRNPSPEARLLAVSVVPIVLWPFVFYQHMILHAWFMDRIFAWIVASGFALFSLAVHDRLTRSSR